MSHYMNILYKYSVFLRIKPKIHAVLILKDHEYPHSPKFILIFFWEYANELTRVLDYR